MTVAKGFLIITLSALTFGIAGGLIGYTLAVALPTFYRTVFPHGNESWFEPREVGIGVGTSQGLLCGLAVGAVVVLAVAWCNSRRGSADVRLTAATREELQRRLSDLAASSGSAVPLEQIQTGALAKFHK